MTAVLELPAGLRAKHYDPAASAALVYEAEALTPLNGAAVVTGVAGASGGKVVQHSTLPAGSWVSALSTSLAPTGTTPLTHTGSYHVWTRVQAVSGTPPQLQFLWGVGSLSAPVTNTAIAMPGIGAFYLMDLGEIRLDPPPTGINQWFGVIQAQAGTANQPLQFDVLYLQPVDDGAGQLTYTNMPAGPVGAIALGPNSPVTGVNNASSGTVAWSNPNNVLAFDSVYATAALTITQHSEILQATGYGFNVPVGTTILGIQATMFYTPSGPGTPVFNSTLVKAGTPTGSTSNVTAGSRGVLTLTYGGPTDLWGVAWTPADINNAGFGFATSFVAWVGSVTVSVDYMSVAVWYQLASGFTVVQDAVVYANQSSELRYDGMYRTPGNNVYGPISQKIGDLPRLPSSGIEQRTVQLFVKPTRGDLTALPDAGLDGFTVQPRYRPCWLSRP